MLETISCLVKDFGFTSVSSFVVGILSSTLNSFLLWYLCFASQMDALYVMNQILNNFKILLLNLKNVKKS